MKKFFLKESKVELYAKEHVKKVYECYKEFEKMMPHFYKGDYEKVDILTRKISALEHEADEIRRKMEMGFYEGAFLPFDREDRIMLTENVDKVADTIESTAFTISLSKVEFPPTFKKDFETFVDIIGQIVEALRDCIDCLEEDLTEAIRKAHEIEKLEEKADDIERRILAELYKSYRHEEIGVVKLLEMKEVVIHLGNIADRAEDASDRVLIIAAKRRG
ncbi:MAG: TIGR00153 family protein [Methanothermobacter sp.]|nr:TIGR00153 family protein [Methanothermobacter sp.]